MDGNAIFGFAGVVVGAGSTYVIQRGAEKREDRANARVAIRLINLDLVQIGAVLSTGLHRGEWWTDQTPPIRIEAPAFELYDAALAKTLSLDDWMAIRHAVFVAESLEPQGVAKAASGVPLDLTEEERAKVANALALVERAKAVSVRLMGTMQPMQGRLRLWLRTRKRKAE